MSGRIALILGSGAGLGSHVASRFRSEGYRVATVSRSLKDAEDDGETAMALECDLADPIGVEKVFEKVRAAWGEPSVVVYNGMLPLIALTQCFGPPRKAGILISEQQHTPSPVARPRKQLWTSQPQSSSNIWPSTQRRLSLRRERR